MDKEAEKEAVELKIKEIVANLTEKMGFNAEIEVKKSYDSEKETIICNIKTEESSFLIGQYGVNLQSLQHIARLLIRKAVLDRINFILDVNDYRQEKNQSIVGLAKEMAGQCLSEKRTVVMRPMSPYERRMVHMELSKDERIKTESIGEGEDRRVAIKPVDLVE
jgi:spoIIIJ-associated protein